MRKSNYDKSPSTTVDGALWKGWESVLDKLRTYATSRKSWHERSLSDVIMVYTRRNWLNTWQHCILL